ncbi:MAG: hypothetical protein M3024_01765 [Candidatus Dormibacteraeota bacterium]|nr:hypothetical protein [Candidatus Dormibacteraeota bacterium]
MAEKTRKPARSPAPALSRLQKGAEALEDARNLEEASRVATAEGAALITESSSLVAAAGGLSDLGDAVQALGRRELAEAETLTELSGEIERLGAEAAALGGDDVGRALELAAISGQVGLARDTAVALGLQTLAGMLGGIAERLRELAVSDLTASTSTGDLAASLRQAGDEALRLGHAEEAEGGVELAAAEGMRDVAADLTARAAAERRLALEEIGTSNMLAEAARQAAREGVRDVAEGAARLPRNRPRAAKNKAPAP